jgi:tetratricopeptide (TPR) repeat protein
MVNRQLWFLKRNSRVARITIPLLAGSMMLCASMLPWLHDPLGSTYSAWQLPVDIGWQFRTRLFNYGLLCLCCALCAFVVAYANWKPFPKSEYIATRYGTLGMICVFPILLFLIQYLCIDIEAITLLAQHKIQVLLLEQHFGYSVSVDRIRVNPFLIDTSTFNSRLLLLIDQVQIGILLPGISIWIFFDARRFISQTPKVQHRSNRSHVSLYIAICLGLCLVCGRGITAMFCDYEARSLLSTGNYTQALTWLNVASTLNPEFNETSFYHIERGRALYYLFPDRQTVEVRVYLASAYRTEGDNLDAYQELLAAWQAERSTPWIIDEMSITLERLAESPKPINNSSRFISANGDSALPWLQILEQVDSSNIYAIYVGGRIQYELHNYSASQKAMSNILQLSSDSNIRSSAYTYMALSDDGQGKYTTARILLLEAIQLDPNYSNNTAREELSGLR